MIISGCTVILIIITQSEVHVHVESISALNPLRWGCHVVLPLPSSAWLAYYCIVILLWYVYIHIIVCMV